MNDNKKATYCNIYRIVVLGVSEVGKTALINNFLNQSFLKFYEPTQNSPDNTYIKMINIGDEDDPIWCVLKIEDTFGLDHPMLDQEVDSDEEEENEEIENDEQQQEQEETNWQSCLSMKKKLKEILNNKNPTENAKKQNQQNDQSKKKQENKKSKNDDKKPALQKAKQIYGYIFVYNCEEFKQPINKKQEKDYQIIEGNTCPQSLKYALEYIKFIEENENQANSVLQTQKILIGNKSDKITTEEQNKIYNTFILPKIDQENLKINHMFTSAYTGENCIDCFVDLAKRIIYDPEILILDEDWKLQAEIIGKDEDNNQQQRIRKKGKNQNNEAQQIQQQNSKTIINPKLQHLQFLQSDDNVDKCLIY